MRRRLETQRQGVGVMMSGRPTYGKVLTVFAERERDESEDSWRALVGERPPIRKPAQQKPNGVLLRLESAQRRGEKFLIYLTSPHFPGAQAHMQAPGQTHNSAAAVLPHKDQG